MPWSARALGEQGLPPPPLLPVIPVIEGCTEPMTLLEFGWDFILVDYAGSQGVLIHASSIDILATFVVHSHWPIVRVVRRTYLASGYRASVAPLNPATRYRACASFLLWLSQCNPRMYLELARQATLWSRQQCLTAALATQKKKKKKKQP